MYLEWDAKGTAGCSEVRKGIRKTFAEWIRATRAGYQYGRPVAELQAHAMRCTLTGPKRRLP